MSRKPIQWLGPVLAGGILFGISMGLFFWWGTRSGVFGLYSGTFSGGVFAMTIAASRVVRGVLPPRPRE